MNGSSEADKLGASRSDNVAGTVTNRASLGRRVVDFVTYMPESDTVIIVARPFAILIEKTFIEEFRDVTAENMKLIKVSASGTTVMLDELNIYVEAAGLVADILDGLRSRNAGGLIMDLAQKR